MQFFHPLIETVQPLVVAAGFALRPFVIGPPTEDLLRALIDEEIETHHEEQSKVAHAFQTLADGVPVALTPGLTWVVLAPLGSAEYS